MLRFNQIWIPDTEAFSPSEGQTLGRVKSPPITLFIWTITGNGEPADAEAVSPVMPADYGYWKIFQITAMVRWITVMLKALL